MTPQAGLFLDKAQLCLDRAAVMVGVGLNEDAGRTAYLAAFHAAQAYIFEQHRKALKTHSGVRTEFLRLTLNETRLDAELRGFLGRAYNLKLIADYGTGPHAPVPTERARQTIATARRFVACITALLPP